MAVIDILSENPYINQRAINANDVNRTEDPLRTSHSLKYFLPVSTVFASRILYNKLHRKVTKMLEMRIRYKLSQHKFINLFYGYFKFYSTRIVFWNVWTPMYTKCERIKLEFCYFIFSHCLGKLFPLCILHNVTLYSFF